jgi:hypothetical protein
MVRTRSFAAGVGLFLALAGALWYLRDPAWIGTQSTGMWDREHGPDGTWYRWTNSHASFFVPSDARAARLRVSTTFDANGSQPMIVTVSIDDVRAATIALTDASWHEIVLPLPPKGSRHERRIDVRTNIVRADNRGVRVADVELAGPGS